MDDYNVNVLSEAKNEYSSRLVTIITPHVIEGIKSIFSEACNLCNENDENEKYLMTFQNFLTRVPKWNSNIITEETTRIIKLSGCTYLEDLLTCVHITQLKILTSIRVSQRQKKIDINIPKISDFIHKIYIAFARKIYSNVYLFEKNITPLQYQKNMRECEILAHECILSVIRDNMPVENILRAYIDETTDEEIIEEVINKSIKAGEEEEPKNEKKEEEEDVPKNIDVIKTEKPELSNNEEKKEENIKLTINEAMEKEIKKEEQEIKSVEKTIKENAVKQENTEPENFTKDENTRPENAIKIDTQPMTQETKSRTLLTFNDTDEVLNLGTNQTSQINAPKNIERLEQLSAIQNKKRKEEEALEEEEEDKLKIFDDVELNLDTLDVHDVNKKPELNVEPILTDVEILS
jgi:hypothetical protein